MIGWMKKDRSARCRTRDLLGKENKIGWVEKTGYVTLVGRVRIGLMKIRIPKRRRKAK